MDKLAAYYWGGCAAGRPEWQVAQGRGTVYALTRVERAPTDEFRALAPYLILLVELDEGYRMMAHGTPGLAIGDRVRAGFFEHRGRSLPRFEPL